jgi:hypothetical protein
MRGTIIIMQLLLEYGTYFHLISISSSCTCNNVTGERVAWFKLWGEEEDREMVVVAATSESAASCCA